MANLPFDPIAAVSATPVPNSDLPPTNMPSLTRIVTTDYVGPVAANQQDRALEKRDEYLRSIIVELVAGYNVLDTFFLRRDGSAAKDGPIGMTGDLAINHAVRLMSMYPLTTNQGAWSNVTAYAPGDYVTYGGNTFTCIVANTGNQPDISYAKWEFAALSGANRGYVDSVIAIEAAARVAGDAAEAAARTAADLLLVPLNGSRTWTGNMNAGGFDITQLGGAFPIGSGSTAAATGGQVFAYLVAGYLPITGATAMTGALNMGSHQINNVTDPSSPQDASTKSYTDGVGAAAVSSAVASANGYTNGYAVPLSGGPWATQAYVTSALAPYLTSASAATIYAPLVSPALTGTPTSATTPAVGDNSTALANTAYVQANIAPAVTTVAETASGGYLGYIKPVGSTVPHADIYCTAVVNVLSGQTVGLVDTNYSNGAIGFPGAALPPIPGQRLTIDFLNAAGVDWNLAIGGNQIGGAGTNPGPSPGSYTTLSGGLPATIASSSIGYIRLVFLAVKASTPTPSGSFSATGAYWMLIYTAT